MAQKGDRFDMFADATARQAGSSKVFLLAVLNILVWASLGPVFHFGNGWQLIINTETTLVTFLMGFLILHTENKNSAAINAKLDELIRAKRDARNEFIGLDQRPESEVKKARGDD